jgi:hypothetical protein
MTQILSGNIDELNNPKQWIFGDFRDHPLPYPFNTKIFEVKWAELKEGQEKPNGPASDPDSMTVTILIEGKHEVIFPESNESKVMSKKGDYVFFEPGVLHSWRALTDNVTITFRWHKSTNRLIK